MINSDDMEYISRYSEKTLQTNSKGFFLDFANNVIKNATTEWISYFGKLKSDEERIEAIYKYKPVRDNVYNTLCHVQEIYRGKSAQVSQQRRFDSQTLLSAGNVEKALMLASQSVLRSPVNGENPEIDDGFTLSLAYWNRATILISQRKYTYAIKDLQIAIKEGFSNDDQTSEAFCKLGLCYQNTGDLNRANISYGLAKTIIGANETFSQKINEYKAIKHNEDKQIDRRVTPIISGKSHPQYPTASYKLDVKHDKQKGRYVVAKQKIQTGETVAIEEPYAACLLPEYFGTHCHHCFERLIAPVGCSTCSSLAFCSPECRDIAINSYHQYECRFLDLLIGSGISILSHTALRMITQRKFIKHDSPKLPHALCTNAHLRLPEDFLQRTLMAAFLLRILQIAGYFHGESNEDVIPDDVELKIGARILYYLQILQFNAHEIYETRIKLNTNQKFSDSKPFYIGVALYPTVALFNHECYPAVTRYFVGKKIVIKSVRPLKPGEIVGENYGPVFVRKPLQERQSYLKVRYWFNCHCQACLQDWPTLKSGLESLSKRLICPTRNCSNFFTLPIQNKAISCPRCNKKIELSKLLENLNIFELLYEKAVETFLNQDGEEASRLLCETIDVFGDILLPPQKEIHNGQEMLRVCWADTGNIYYC